MSATPLSKAQPSAVKPFWEPNSAPPDNSEKVNSVLAALAGIGYVVTEEDLGKLNPPDEFETELKVMAEIRGYCQVSYKVRTPAPFSALVQVYSWLLAL